MVSSLCSVATRWDSTAGTPAMQCQATCFKRTNTKALLNVDLGMFLSWQFPTLYSPDPKAWVLCCFFLIEKLILFNI